MIDKDELKQSLTVAEVFDIVNKLHGNPTYSSEGLVADTICHNESGGSHKLYYYDSSKSFHCYTGDCGSFDIYDLVKKACKLQKNEDLTFESCVYYVVEATGRKNFQFSVGPVLQDSGYEEANSLLGALDRIETYKDKETVVLKEYPDNLIKNLPTYDIASWEKDGITYDTMKKYEIRYYAPTNKIVIPHRDINGRLVGIRGRSLTQEDIDNYGKYMPLYIGDNLSFPHPLGYNLYGIDKNKENIQKIGKAILFEGEKSVMALDSVLDNNFSVAACGSNLTQYQFDILLSLNIQELIIAFDRQYKNYCDEEWKQWQKKYEKIKTMCSRYVNVTFMYDKAHRLDYKDSPIDKGKDIFYELLEERNTI